MAKSESKVVGIDEGLERLAKAAGIDGPGDGVDLPTVSMDQVLSHEAHQIGQVLADAPLYRWGKGFVTVDMATGDTEAMDANRFSSWVESFLYMTKVLRSGEEILTMKRDHAASVLASDRFREQIKELKAINEVRLPVWRGADGVEVGANGPFWHEQGLTLELLPKGFDDETGILTLDNVPYQMDMDVEEATSFLAEVLSGFPFAQEEGIGKKRTFGGQLATMIGSYCKSLFPDGMSYPMVIWNANQSGSGKSLLMRACLGPVYGAVAEDSKSDNAELQKKLDICALSRAPYLVLDDCKTLHSTELNRFLTSPTHKPRVLGKSVQMSCPNVTQVFATGNALNLSVDLCRRALVVDLFEPRVAVEREFENVLTSGWFALKKTRARFLAAYWSMLREWVARGMPHDPTAIHNSAPEWANVIGSIIRSYDERLEPFADRKHELGGDHSGEALVRLICIAADRLPDSGGDYTPEQLIDLAEEESLLESIAGHHAKDMRKSLGHKLKHVYGRIYVDPSGREFEVVRGRKTYGRKYPIQFIDDTK